MQIPSALARFCLPVIHKLAALGFLDAPREELATQRVEINEDKSRTIDLRKGGSFGFLGYEFRLVQDRNEGGDRSHIRSDISRFSGDTIRQSEESANRRINTFERPET